MFSRVFFFFLFPLPSFDHLVLGQKKLTLPFLFFALVSFSSKLSQQEKLQAALLVTSAGALASPIIPSAEAATVSPSLSNLLYSVFWGTGILVAIATGLSAISSFDKIKR